MRISIDLRQASIGGEEKTGRGGHKEEDMRGAQNDVQEHAERCRLRTVCMRDWRWDEGVERT